mmetsp:Transcript_2733/g.3853  ORF Transcript_2733/g.3853 Transcript_2733/m.3853 type:complete len:400 (+) Transcript_2733:131-1330(+)
MRALLVLGLCLTNAFGIASSDHCFSDPALPNCVDALAYYPANAQHADIEMACAQRPWTTGCSLWRKCRSGLATGTHCQAWGLLHDVCNDEVTAGTESCKRYQLLCPANSETVVKQCTEETGVPSFLHTATAIQAMLDLCEAMPLMEWCSECTSSQNPAVNCMDPLGSISSICLDHYMEDCRPWYDMCRQQPAGLEAICGTNGDFQMDTLDNACFGQMKMYFHTGFTDFILWDTWVPCTVERYIGALVALFITGIFTGFLKAVRARLEQRWMKELRDEPPLPEGSWAFLPTGQQRWMNLMRFVFVFVTVTLDYALMLAAMTFNYGIFFAVILGMAAGSLFFGHTVVPIRTRSSKPTHQRLPLDTQTDGSETSSTSPDGDIVGTSIAVKSSGSSCCVDMPL